MSKHWVIIFLFFFSFSAAAQVRPDADLEEALNFIERAWDFSIDVAPVFKYYVSDENIADLKLICFDNREKLDSIYFLSKEATYKASDAANAASDMEFFDIEEQSQKAREYLENAETDFTNALSSIDLLLDQNNAETIYMHLYDAEDYFINARQQLKKAEKEIEKAMKDLQKIK